MKILERRMSAQCLAFCVLLFLFVSSCKRPEDIGLAILPQSDLLNATHIDTLTLQTMTVREDSLQANALSRLLLGSYVDPDFGISQAGIYTQVLLGITPILGTNPTTDILKADSVVLSLVYAGFYADTSSSLSQQVVHVYKLTQDMNVDSTYYSNITFTDSSSFDYAHSFKFQPNTVDSITVDTLREPAQLRITLDSSLANSLVALNNSIFYQSNDNWTPYFKGFHIKVDAATTLGAILYFDPANPYTKMTLYYHDITTGNVAMTYDFFLTGARVNNETHNYTGYPAANHIADSTFTDSLNYLQSMSGLKVKFNIPYLGHLRDSGNVIINKAELVIKVEPNTANTFAVPTDLFLSAYDSTGKINLLADYFEGNFGGSFNVSDNTYRFIISRQIQQIVDGKIGDYGFSLNVLSGGVQANRVIIGSGKGGASKMKLNLYYTKLRK